LSTLEYEIKRESATRAAAAVNGDRSALVELLEGDRDGRCAERERLGPALALTAGRQGLDGKALPAWRRALHGATVQSLQLDVAFEAVAQALVGLDWLPFKGFDLAARVYDLREERPSADLDLLVRKADFEIARTALLATGFTAWSSGPLSERYLREEGYAWAARAPNGVLVELHFRLWGSVPAELGDALVDASEPADKNLGRRLRPGHALVVAAVHLWLEPPPRAAGRFRDLERLAAHFPDLAEEAVALARRFGLHLPVVLGACGAEALFGSAPCGVIAANLRSELRRSERHLADRLDLDVSTQVLGLARLLARRRSRLGWRHLWRWAWPHAGVVEAGSPPTWPFWRRRLWYQYQTLLRPGR
jgi:Uncharacterised nucleotidyltransferase